MYGLRAQSSEIFPAQMENNNETNCTQNCIEDSQHKEASETKAGFQL
jgi:hypothetical protein